MNKTIIVMMVCLVMGMSACTNGSTAPVAPETKTSGDASLQLETVKLQQGALAQQVRLPAQLASFEEVSIFPKVNGYVKDVLVDVGSRVHRGQLLMVLEAPELEQAVMQAKEKYAQAKLDYTINEQNYQRMLQASETPGAVSPMNLASLKAKADADSTVTNAEKANWQMEQAILGYLQVTAPFDGVITERNVHPGALVSAEGKDGKPMLHLGMTEHLRLQVDIPEGIAANLGDKDTLSFYLSAFPGKKMTGRIARRSDLVNSEFRAERVELDVYNKEGKLAPGMYAEVLFNSNGNAEGYAVPRTAVVTNQEQKYVIAVRNGKAVRVDVATGNETSNKVEITGDLHPGEEIVKQASDEINEGISIR